MCLWPPILFYSQVTQKISFLSKKTLFPSFSSSSSSCFFSLSLSVSSFLLCDYVIYLKYNQDPLLQLFSLSFSHFFCFEYVEHNYACKNQNYTKSCTYLRVRSLTLFHIPSTLCRNQLHCLLVYPSCDSFGKSQHTCLCVCISIYKYTILQYSVQKVFPLHPDDRRIS